MYIVILCDIYSFLRCKSKYFVKIFVYLYRGNNRPLCGPDKIANMIKLSRIVLMFLFVGILVACQPRERVIDYPAFQAKILRH